MLRDLLSHKYFFGVLGVFVLIAVSGTLYLKHIEYQTEQEFKQLEEGGTETVRVPEGGVSQDRHWQTDETWHATPETPRIQRGVPVESETTVSIDVPGETSTELFSEVDTSVENPIQRGHDFVFNSPTLYPHEILQWTKDFLSRLQANHPKLLRMSQMTPREVLEAYTPAEIEALNKEWLKMKDDFLAEFHALVRALPEEMRTPVIEEVYKESIETYGSELAEKSMAILFPEESR